MGTGRIECVSVVASRTAHAAQPSSSGNSEAPQAGHVRLAIPGSDGRILAVNGVLFPVLSVP